MNARISSLPYKVIFYAGSFTINIDCSLSLFFFLSNITKVKDIISANLEKKKHRIRTGEKYLIPHYQIDINENNERTHLITIDTNFFFFLITSIQVKV